MIDYKQAVLDPTSVFKHPEDVLQVSDKELSKKQKIKILRSWEYDAREIEVAEEENMQGRSQDLLAAILKALLKLGVKNSIENPAPTKHGGD